MNPPSTVLGGGEHGKVCWFIAYIKANMLMLSDKLSLQRALDIIKQFSVSAGPKLNLEKK